MYEALRKISPRRVVRVMRVLIGVSVVVGFGCFKAIDRVNLPQRAHDLEQAGAALLLAAFFAAVAIAVYAAYSDLDMPQAYWGRRKWR